MSDTETTIQPALTPEEWKAYRPSDDVYVRGVFVAGFMADGEERFHAAAAVALYGQLFGFTQEDVAELRDVAELWEQEAVVSDEHQNGLGVRDDGRGMWEKNAETCRRRAAATRSIAAKIAALLPRPRVTD